MNMKAVLIKICTFLFLLSFIFSTNAEKYYFEVSYEDLNDDVIETIRQEVGLPGDYDINRAMKGMNYLVLVEGFTASGAAGLIGNGYVESRLLLNSGNGFYKGLFQWDGKCRWPKIKKYLEDNDVDFENQEELFIWELIAALNSEDADNYQEVIEFCKQSDSAYDSADRWCRIFEGTKHSLSSRKKNAELTLTAYRLYIKLCGTN